MRLSVFVTLSFFAAAVGYSQEGPPTTVPATALNQFLSQLTVSIFEALQKNEPLDIARIQKARAAVANSKAYPPADPFRIATLSLLATFANADREYANAVAEYAKVKNQKNINALRAEAEFEKTKESRLAALESTWRQRSSELRAGADQQLAKCQSLLERQPLKMIASDDPLFELVYERPMSLGELKGKAMAAINESELYIRITNITQISDDGVIMGGMNASDKKGHFLGSAETWYLVGFDASGSTDGSEIGGFKVYRAGTYKYTTVQGSSRTVPRYAASADLAYKLMLADEVRKKESSDGESKPKLPKSY
jgi:hypothetical protein